MDTPFYHDGMSGAFAPHHQYPHRFHGDYERYPSSSSGGKAAAASKKAAATPYFPGLGSAGPGAGVKAHPLGAHIPGPSRNTDADLLLAQAANHGLASSGRALVAIITFHATLNRLLG